MWLVTNQNRALMCISSSCLLWGIAWKKWWYTRLELWNHIGTFICCHCFGGWIAMRISLAIPRTSVLSSTLPPTMSSDSNAARLLRGCPGNCHPEVSIVLSVNTKEGDKALLRGSALNYSFYSVSNVCLQIACDLLSHNCQSFWHYTHSFFAYV